MVADYSNTGCENFLRKLAAVADRPPKSDDAISGTVRLPSGDPPGPLTMPRAAVRGIAAGFFGAMTIVRAPCCGTSLAPRGRGRVPGFDLT